MLFYYYTNLIWEGFLMYQSAKQPKKLKIAYIGGGSRGWAWTLMDDLSKADDLCGEVALYDIDFAAAQANETIGALAGGGFTYRAYESPKEALTGADFVIISIMRARLTKWNPTYIRRKNTASISPSATRSAGRSRARPADDSHVRNDCRLYSRLLPTSLGHQLHQPNECLCKNALRSVPANQGVWVLPRGIQHAEALCQRAVRAAWNRRRKAARHSCQRRWHQSLHLDYTGIPYYDIDLMELYKEYIKKYPDGIGTHEPEDYFGCMHRVKFDLFTRFGAVAASGDRHLAEFCPGNCT